jgi:hypothetical protein
MTIASTLVAADLWNSIPGDAIVALQDRDNQACCIADYKMLDEHTVVIRVVDEVREGWGPIFDFKQIGVEELKISLLRQVRVAEELAASAKKSLKVANDALAHLTDSKRGLRRAIDATSPADQKARHGLVHREAQRNSEEFQSRYGGHRPDSDD